MRRKFLLLITVMWLCSGCRTFLIPTVEQFPVFNPVSNPFAKLADVQLVGCYGKRSTATVEFVFTVTTHSNLIQRGTFGAYPDTKFVARGKAYKPYNSAGTTVEIVRNIPSDVVISDIREVPDYIVQFDRIEIQWYFNPSHHSGVAKHNLVFNNVPVIWE